MVDGFDLDTDFVPICSPPRISITAYPGWDDRDSKCFVWRSLTKLERIQSVILFGLHQSCKMSWTKPKCWGTTIDTRLGLLAGSSCYSHYINFAGESCQLDIRTLRIVNKSVREIVYDVVKVPVCNLGQTQIWPVIIELDSRQDSGITSLARQWCRPGVSSWCRSRTLLAVLCFLQRLCYFFVTEFLQIWQE